jgi:anti-anti-sigma regulatory factor/GAF domain-containing protein
VSHAIAGASDIPSLIRALKNVMTPYGADACALFRWHPADVNAKVVAAWDKQGEAPLPAGTRVSRAAFRAFEGSAGDEPILIDDCDGDAGLNTDLKRSLTGLGARSAIVVPLSHDGERRGVFLIARHTKQRPAPDEVRIHGLLGKLALVALLTMDSRVELATKVKRVHGLYRISEAVGEAADEQEALTKTALMLVNDIHYVASWVGTVDEEAELLRERGLAGLAYYPGRDPVNFPLADHTLSAVAALHGSHKAYADAQERADAEGWGETARVGGLRSVAYIPLRAGGVSVGVLSIGSQEERISEDDLSLLGAFCGHLASTILRFRTNEEREKQVVALAEANQRQAELWKTVREMSTPVIPVHRGVLVLPIVGMLDSARSAQLTESLLAGIQKERASVVIIDVTGVPTVDTGAAHHLLQSTRAASLLGAACVLVGISPQVAQTLVQIGVELKGLTTRSNLQAGIAYALTLLGEAR